MEGDGGKGGRCGGGRRVGVYFHGVVEVASCADSAGVEGTAMGEDGVADMVATWEGLSVVNYIAGGLDSKREGNTYPYQHVRLALLVHGGEKVASCFHRLRNRICCR